MIVRIDILGPLVIHAPGLVVLDVSTRARLLLVMLGLRPSYRQPEIVNVLWPGDDVYDPDSVRKKQVRDRLHRVLGEAREMLGKARPRLRSRGGVVELARGYDTETNTLLTSDLDELYAVSGMRDADSLREALQLVRGRLGDGLAVSGDSLEWIGEQQERVCVTITLMARRAFSLTSERAEVLVSDILARGASLALGPLLDVDAATDHAGLATTGDWPSGASTAAQHAAASLEFDTQTQMVDDLTAFGIRHVYPHREPTVNPDNALTRLRGAFRAHQAGTVRMMGVSLRVFFNHLGPFYSDIDTLLSTAEKGPSLQALTLHPDCAESEERAQIEEPGIQGLATPQIVRDIESTAATIRRMVNAHGPHIELRQFRQAPYCTAILFPGVAYFSPNILAPAAPVQLPMVLFDADSHGYRMLTLSFEFLWQHASLVVPAPQIGGSQAAASTHRRHRVTW